MHLCLSTKLWMIWKAWIDIIYYFQIILNVCIISTEKDWHLDGEFTVFEEICLEKFVMGEYFATNQIGVLLKPLLIYFFRVCATLIKKSITHDNISNVTY